MTLLSRREAAARTGRSERTIRRWVLLGLIVPVEDASLVVEKSGRGRPPSRDRFDEMEVLRLEQTLRHNAARTRFQRPAGS